MDPPAVVRFPNVSTDPIEHDILEIDAAIGLVSCGVATRVHLIGLMAPEAVAAIGLAHTQQANVGFSLDRNPDGGATVIVGPRD